MVVDLESLGFNVKLIAEHWLDYPSSPIVTTSLPLYVLTNLQLDSCRVYAADFND